MGMILSSIAAAWLIGTTVQGGPDAPPARIEAFLKRCEESRRGTILELEHKLRGLESQKSTSPQSARQIARLKEDLRVLRANREPIVPQLSFPPEVGAIGRLPRLTCHVEQVMSEREMVVRCFFPLKVVSVEHFQARGETVVRPVLFLVRGLSTKGRHEGEDLALDQVFEITGRRAFRAVSGRTSEGWTVQEFDMKSIAPYFKPGDSGTTR